MSCSLAKISPLSLSCGKRGWCLVSCLSGTLRVRPYCLVLSRLFNSLGMFTWLLVMLLVLRHLRLFSSLLLLVVTVFFVPFNLPFYSFFIPATHISLHFVTLLPATLLESHQFHTCLLLFMTIFFLRKCSPSDSHSLCDLNFIDQVSLLSSIY